MRLSIIKRWPGDQLSQYGDRADTPEFTTHSISHASFTSTSSTKANPLHSPTCKLSLLSLCPRIPHMQSTPPHIHLPRFSTPPTPANSEGASAQVPQRDPHRPLLMEVLDPKRGAGKRRGCTFQRANRHGRVDGRYYLVLLAVKLKSHWGCNMVGGWGEALLGSCS